MRLGLAGGVIVMLVALAIVIALARQPARVDEYVLAATVGLNEAEALLVVVELYGARVH